jgi:subtilisin-like proprotein convertase family protein
MPSGDAGVVVFAPFGRSVTLALGLVFFAASAACAVGAEIPADSGPVDARPKPDAMEEPRETVCSDNADDDGDGSIDCADSDCVDEAVCQPEQNCQNGADDEGDGKVDCLDKDCDGKSGCQFGQESACADKLDNDGDSQIDCADVNCSGLSGCEFGQEVSCTGGIDNDGDGLTDCADPDCNGSATCVPETACQDGVDNDQDGKKDCADFDCAGVGTCQPGGETSCQDGLDNDADGKIDCLDPSCDGVGFCETGTEDSCADGQDNDADGKSDCADSDCAAQAACVAGCAAGSVATAYVATGLPATIPDSSSMFREFTVTGPAVITKVLVRISVDHVFIADVDVSLTAPGSTAIDVSSDNGGSDEDYLNTLFTDAASKAITAGFPPYTGSFKPEQPFAPLSGRSAVGAWKLTLADDEAGYVGKLTAATLYLCTCMGTAGCEFGAACQDGIDDDGDTLIDCADPDCGAITQCIPESLCADGIDNDLDGKIDCLDSQCDGKSGCQFGSESLCADGKDNDADGLTDCQDSNCAQTIQCMPESNCHDGIDNNMDGTVDCQDPRCDGIGGCELGGEVTCSDGIDNDSDGQSDCAEANCAFACSLPACASGEILLGGKASDLPKPIPDVATTPSTITVGRTGSVRRVVVRFSASHNYDSDLDIRLVSPAGTTIDLSSDNGGSLDNYTQTVFIDSASKAITAGSPPFTGSFRPEAPLSTLINQTVKGAWRLDVIDDSSGVSGTFTQYELGMCIAP